MRMYRYKQQVSPTLCKNFYVRFKDEVIEILSEYMKFFAFRVTLYSILCVGSNNVHVNSRGEVL